MLRHRRNAGTTWVTGMAHQGFGRAAHSESCYSCLLGMAHPTARYMFHSLGIHLPGRAANGSSGLKTGPIQREDAMRCFQLSIEKLSLKCGMVESVTLRLELDAYSAYLRQKDVFPNRRYRYDRLWSCKQALRCRTRKMAWHERDTHPARSQKTGPTVS